MGTMKTLSDVSKLTGLSNIISGHKQRVRGIIMKIAHKINSSSIHKSAVSATTDYKQEVELFSREGLGMSSQDLHIAAQRTLKHQEMSLRNTLQLVNATEQGAENIPNSIGYNPFEVITEKAGFISEVTQKAINISMYPPPTIIRKDK